jgi:hypothetical protein
MITGFPTILSISRLFQCFTPGQAVFFHNFSIDGFQLNRTVVVNA